MPYMNQTRRGEFELFLYGDVGGPDGINAAAVAEELREAKNADIIRVEIFSGGGSVFDGNAIYENLVRHNARIEVDVISLAASIASLIAMAGDEIRMADGSWLMIHKPFVATVGDADELRSLAELLDRMEDTTILTAYTKQTSKNRGEIRDMLRAETWMTAEDAVEHGFANRVVEEAASRVAASFDRSGYFNALSAKATDYGYKSPLEALASVRESVQQVAEADVDLDLQLRLRMAQGVTA